ncbi:hypothetical protein [uncultured Clostridium sp.]|uniref:hypothetical protein n=1 Tax=uncultured Clostridium sp. TaxID=59620 RepID=UPI002628FC0B|nr:hypothetical protein [uncultured Clostridium sp.]
MTLITIVTKDLLIENCYLEKQYDYLIALKKERFIISYINFKVYKLKFLYKYLDGTKIYSLIEKGD